MSSDVLVQMRYFGVVAEKTGCSEEQMKFTRGSTLDQLYGQLVQTYPSLSDSDFVISHNQRLSKGGEVLSDGDEVALLPPFAGG